MMKVWQACANIQSSWKNVSHMQSSKKWVLLDLQCTAQHYEDVYLDVIDCASGEAISADLPLPVLQ